MAPSSSTVASGDTILATQYNNLRSDVLDPTTGHNHNATDGRTLFSVYTRFVRKTAIETLNSNAVLQNDDHLFFSVGSSETWWIVGELDLSTNVTADFQMTFTTPTLAASFIAAELFPDGAVTPEQISGAITATLAFTTPAADDVVRFEAMIVTTGSGTVQLQWAQRVSDAGGTSLQAGSWLAGMRMA